MDVRTMPFVIDSVICIQDENDHENNIWENSEMSEFEPWKIEVCT